MLKTIKNYLPVLLISVVVLFAFWNLPKTFYQQDEWQSLGHNLADGLGIFANMNPIPLLFGELRSLSGLMYLLFLGYYKFTVVPTAIFAILFQIINSSLVFYLVDKITKKRIIAFTAAIFLITNSVSHQAVTWVSAMSTLPATTLILIAILGYLKYFETTKRKYLLIGIFSAILSLYFKGVGLFLFILLPTMLFIYKNKKFDRKNIKDVLRINSPLLIFGFLMFVFRFGEVFFRTEKVAGFVEGGENFTQSVLIHLVLYPLTSLFQIFVPPLDLYSITPNITVSQYKFLIGSPLKDLVAQSIVADMVSILGSMIILGLLALVAYKYKDKVTKRNIFFALAFFFLSFLPYAVLHRESSYLSSRYFYVGAIGAGILFGYIVYFLSSLNKFSKWIVFPLVFLFLFHHANIVRGDINYQVKLGNERKAVLNGIKELKPTLDNKTIFYVTSDKEYYGPITNPFQNGLGYVLEVWYFDTGKIPKEFLSENFLWDLGAEGYRELSDKGFGYFQDLDKLAETVKDKNLSEDIVHAFFFDSKTKRVIDKTPDIRDRISTLSATTR